MDLRSYTTVEQSRKLAEILPLESADMFYDGYKDVLGNGEISYQIDIISNWTTAYPNKSLFEKSDDMTIPCWSLAALLNVLPSRYVVVKSYHSLYFVESRDYKKSTNIFNNPIDACYEMILKLHEQNSL